MLETGSAKREARRRAMRRRAKPEKPLWEKIVERGKRIPPEELANFPSDGARNVDHYVYGSADAGSGLVARSFAHPRAAPPAHSQPRDYEPASSIAQRTIVVPVLFEK